MQLISNPKQRGILVVDDEINTVATIKNLLEDCGYCDVYTALDGLDALSKLTSEPEKIYLLILDLWMPNMDGFELVRHLTNVHSHPVGVIVITGHGSHDAAAEFFKMETETVMTSNFIEKPLSCDRLLVDIERTLDLVHKKRLGSIQISGEVLHKRLDLLQKKLEKLQYVFDNYREKFTSSLSSLQCIHDRLDMIEKDLRVVNCLPTINDNVQELKKNNRGFITEIGLDLIRALVVACALLALIYLGIGDFIKRIIVSVK